MNSLVLILSEVLTLLVIPDLIEMESFILNMSELFNFKPVDILILHPPLYLSLSHHCASLELLIEQNHLEVTAKMGILLKNRVFGALDDDGLLVVEITSCEKQRSIWLEKAFLRPKGAGISLYVSIV